MEGCVHVARHLLYEKDAFQDFGAANSRAFKLGLPKKLFFLRGPLTCDPYFWVMWADIGISRRENTGLNH